MRSVWNFATAGQLTMGRGAAREFALGLGQRGVRRAMLVSDRTLEQVGHVSRIADWVREGGAELTVCLEGQPEPSIEDANRCIGQAREVRPG